jgi:solute carrier family 25 folate transporter 32
MGAGSKIIASTITYPIQLIKSRLQQRKQTAEITADGQVEIVKREYRGVIDCATKIWKREGIQGFFKGTIPNALRVAPSSAITFVVYESVTDYLTHEF